MVNVVKSTLLIDCVYFNILEISKIEIDRNSVVVLFVFPFFSFFFGHANPAKAMMRDYGKAEE